MKDETSQLWKSGLSQFVLEIPIVLVPDAGDNIHRYDVESHGPAIRFLNELLVPMPLYNGAVRNPDKMISHLQQLVSDSESNLPISALLSYEISKNFPSLGNYIKTEKIKKIAIKPGLLLIVKHIISQLRKYQSNLHPSTTTYSPTLHVVHGKDKSHELNRGTFIPQSSVNYNSYARKFGDYVDGIREIDTDKANNFVEPVDGVCNKDYSTKSGVLTPGMATFMCLHGIYLG